MKSNRKKGTATRAFGSPARRNHDSSAFYSGRLYGNGKVSAKPDYVENPLPEEVVNCVLAASSENMHHLPDCSVHLMVTSPPYNVGKEYDENLTLAEYRAFLSRVWAECYRVLVPGGRACVNVANLGRKPYIPPNGCVAQDMTESGFLMRGEIIWDKTGAGAGSTAWGSWLSPANPTLRDGHEYILVFSKEGFGRVVPEGRQPTIKKEQFLEYTRSVWRFPPESARRVGHPAPFPVELPERLIRLYTWSDEVVLDPFLGSGTAGIAALSAGRRFVGYETSPEYAELARVRIEQARRTLSRAPSEGE